MSSQTQPNTIATPTGKALLERARAIAQLPAPRQRRLIREQAGCSQREIAAALGVHTMTVNRWERDMVRPRGSGAIRYIDLLRQLEQATTGGDAR